MRSPSGAGELKGWEGGVRREGGVREAERERADAGAPAAGLRTTGPWGPSCDVGVYPEVKGE